MVYRIKDPILILMETTRAACTRRQILYIYADSHRVTWCILTTFNVSKVYLLRINSHVVYLSDGGVQRFRFDRPIERSTHFDQRVPSVNIESTSKPAIQPS